MSKVILLAVLCSASFAQILPQIDWNTQIKNKPTLGNATQIQGRNVVNTAPTNSQVICWNNGASRWEPCAVNTNATQLQGKNVSSTVPTNTQVLCYVSGNNDWEPCNPASSSNATQLQGRSLAAAAPSNSQVICWVSGNNDWEPCTTAAGSSGAFTTTNYQYTQSPAQTLTAGATASVTLTPCPAGLQPTNAAISAVTSYNLTITGATNANPIVITTTQNPNNLVSGQVVVIANVAGNTAANGVWPITVTGANTFTISAAGSGAYVSGGTVTDTLVTTSAPHGFGAAARNRYFVLYSVGGTASINKILHYGTIVDTTHVSLNGMATTGSYTSGGTILVAPEFTARITDNTSGSEAVPIEGGTCTDGAGSGTVIITPAINHTSGQWSIADGTGGIVPCLVYAELHKQSTTGTVRAEGSCTIPNGDYSIYGPIDLAFDDALFGSGRSVTKLVFQYQAGDFMRILGQGNDCYATSAPGGCVNTHVANFDIWGGYPYGPGSQTSGTGLRIVAKYHGTVENLNIIEAYVGMTCEGCQNQISNIEIQGAAFKGTVVAPGITTQTIGGQGAGPAGGSQGVIAAPQVSNLTSACSGTGAGTIGLQFVLPISGGTWSNIVIGGCNAAVQEDSGGEMTLTNFILDHYGSNGLVFTGAGPTSYQQWLQIEAAGNPGSTPLSVTGSNVSQVTVSRLIAGAAGCSQQVLISGVGGFKLTDSNITGCGGMSGADVGIIVNSNGGTPAANVDIIGNKVGAAFGVFYSPLYIQTGAHTNIRVIGNDFYPGVGNSGFNAATSTGGNIVVLHNLGIDETINTNPTVTSNVLNLDGASGNCIPNPVYAVTGATTTISSIVACGGTSWAARSIDLMFTNSQTFTASGSTNGIKTSMAVAAGQRVRCTLNTQWWCQ